MCVNILGEFRPTLPEARKEPFLRMRNENSVKNHHLKYCHIARI